MTRVLIIDDDSEIRTLVQRVLTGAGYETAVAEDGREGMKLQQKQPADLIITDLIMPGQEGLETIIEMRRRFPKVKIIAMSGGGHGGVLDFLPMASQLGAALTLAKPFTPDRLLTAVREVMAG
jgi:DNA-binding NtrC family response regulator